MSSFPSSTTRTISVRQLPKFIIAFSVVCLSITTANAGQIAWQKDLTAASRLAARSHKPLLVMVGARWCGYCEQMKQQTLVDATIARRVTDDFVPVMIDADEQPEMTARLNAESLPTLLVMSADAKVLRRMTGFQSAAQLDGQLATYHSTQPVRQFRPTYTSFWRTHSVKVAPQAVTKK